MGCDMGTMDCNMKKWVVICGLWIANEKRDCNNMLSRGVNNGF